MTASSGAERVTRADDELRRTLARINGRAWGVAMGLVLGLGLAIATLFLVIKGVNSMKKKEPEPAPAGPTVDQKLLMEIRDLLKK